MTKPLTVGDLLSQITALKKTGKITNQTKLIYASDDEGNEYQWCIFLPNIMNFDRDIEYGERLEIDYHEEEQTGAYTYLCLN